MYKFKSFIDINKINEILPNIIIIINYIILPGCMFGSIYILSTTLKLINNINGQHNIISVTNNLITLHKLNCLLLIILLLLCTNSKVL
jgi:hypothetical protein